MLIFWINTFHISPHKIILGNLIFWGETLVRTIVHPCDDYDKTMYGSLLECNYN